MVNRKQRRKLGVGLVLSAGLLAATGPAFAITVDGNLTDLITAVGSASVNQASGTDPMGGADSPTTENNNGFDIKDTYAWYDVSIDTLYLGMNFYGTVGDSRPVTDTTTTCERDSACTVPSLAAPANRNVFDSNEAYSLWIYAGTDTSGPNLLAYLLQGQDAGGETLLPASSNPFGLLVTHSVSETNNGVEYSIAGLNDSGALGDFSNADPADLFLYFGAGSADVTSDTSSATEDNFGLQMQVVPVPAAVWLFGSGLAGLVGVARRKASRHN